MLRAWGGPDWEQRAAPGRLTGVTVSVRDPEAVADRWDRVLAARPDGLVFKQDPLEHGLTEFAVAVPGRGGETKIGGVTFRFTEEDQ